ncbi:hypothetical protein P355_0431 [Burkholderia cenocepacia KC-01]|nr:hypothetical protein P355_0431 [Burkholderia cenocepacia KC-01]
MSTRLGAITYYTYRDNMRGTLSRPGGRRHERRSRRVREERCFVLLGNGWSGTAESACGMPRVVRDTQKKRGRGGRVNTRRLLRTKETSNCETKCSERPRTDSEAMLQRSLPGSGSLPERAPIDYHQG